MKTGKITTIGQLRERIRELEHQDYVNQQHMRMQVLEVADRFKPVNILRNVIGNIFHDGRETKLGLLRMGLGLVTSLLVKKFFKKGLRR